MTVLSTFSYICELDLDKVLVSVFLWSRKHSLHRQALIYYERVVVSFRMPKKSLKLLSKVRMNFFSKETAKVGSKLKVGCYLRFSEMLRGLMGKKYFNI